jgi:protein-S-isoprenylcysteine O-methyltransferase Ste14
MPPIDYAILFGGWLLWIAPFVLAKRKAEKASTLDPRARWGILLTAVSYSVLWQGRFWETTPAPWRVGLSIAFLTMAAVLTWTSRWTLGRQWRIDAALNADHELVRTGPYGVIRHPIYASLFCLQLGTAFMIASYPLMAISLVVLIIGTEIRVRVEDGLLASRFGDQFQEYRRRVRAYVPFVR